MTEGSFITIDNVQLAMPRSGQQEARSLYAGLLGMTEPAQPPEFAKRWMLVSEWRRTTPSWG
ncbi:MAG: hypothetical protein WB660_08535 [Candidatus Sulfotelmatobacter sp.]